MGPGLVLLCLGTIPEEHPRVFQLNLKRRKFRGIPSKVGVKKPNPHFPGPSLLEGPETCGLAMGHSILLVFFYLSLLSYLVVFHPCERQFNVEQSGRRDFTLLYPWWQGAFGNMFFGWFGGYHYKKWEGFRWVTARLFPATIGFGLASIGFDGQFIFRD